MDSCLLNDGVRFKVTGVELVTVDTGTDGDTSGTDAVIGTVELEKGVTGATAGVK